MKQQRVETNCIWYDRYIRFMVAVVRAITACHCTNFGWRERREKERERAEAEEKERMREI